MADKKTDLIPAPVLELPIVPMLQQAGFADDALAEMGAEGIMAINELFMSLTQKPENYHGDDVSWKIPTLQLVQGLTNRDGIDVPLTATMGDIVADGEVLFAAGDGKKAGLKCVCVHMCKTYTYFPPKESEERIRTVFEQTYNEVVPAPEKVYDNAPGGFKTCWRVGYDYVIIPLDMSGIYKIRFVKSSGKAGRILQRKVATWGTLYQFPIGIYSKEDSSDIGNQKVTYAVFDFTLEAATPVPPAVKALAKLVGTAYDAHYLEAVAQDIEYERKTRQNAMFAGGSSAPSAPADLNMDAAGGFDDDV